MLMKNNTISPHPHTQLLKLVCKMQGRIANNLDREGHGLTDFSHGGLFLEADLVDKP